jgi:hypothetical protein
MFRWLPKYGKNMTDSVGQSEQTGSDGQVASGAQNSLISKSANNSGDTKRYERFVAQYFMISVAGGWIIELFYGLAAEPDFASGLRTFCLIWFASAAGFFAGSSAGFLFAVPKSISGPDVPASQRRFKVNTNLEDVSDWLTKIILGLGLVNIDKIIQFINAVGNAAAKAIGPAQGVKLMVISSMIYGFVAAFIIVYIWTRTILTDEFEKK